LRSVFSPSLPQPMTILTERCPTIGGRWLRNIRDSIQKRENNFAITGAAKGDESSGGRTGDGVRREGLRGEERSEERLKTCAEAKFNRVHDVGFTRCCPSVLRTDLPPVTHYPKFNLNNFLSSPFISHELVHFTKPFMCQNTLRCCTYIEYYVLSSDRHMRL
jgi:hypothetical protein